MSFSMPRPGASAFENTLAPFLQADGLPFADVLSAADIDQAFQDEPVSFGQTTRAFWTPALTLWTFLSQVLHAGKSCRAAVARAFVALALSRPLKDLDTGNYCRARAQLPTPVLSRLTRQLGRRLEEEAPVSWLWHARHVVLVDGFTITLPDTLANQQAYPQPNTQKEGLGFPLLRVVALLSLATAATWGVAFGPCQGKESGETALLRQLLEELPPGSIVLADRFYCSYFMVALLRSCGVDVVMRLHQRRKSDFRCGRRLGPNDHVVQWLRPERPDWMDEATYASMPETLEVREIRKQVNTPGYRVSQLDVITTLADDIEYSTNDIADLYHERWHVEVDIRTIKSTLNMDELRCKTPEMVAKELWVHFLGYNLIRKVAAQAALQAERCPREISFAASQQLVLGAWSQLTEGTQQQQLQLAQGILVVLGKEVVGNRPNRCEPRAVKRRPKKQKLLTKPRKQARAELLAGRGGKAGR